MVDLLCLDWRNRMVMVIAHVLSWCDPSQLPIQLNDQVNHCDDLVRPNVPDVCPAVHREYCFPIRIHLNQHTEIETSKRNRFDRSELAFSEFQVVFYKFLLCCFISLRVWRKIALITRMIGNTHQTSNEAQPIFFLVRRHWDGQISRLWQPFWKGNSSSAKTPLNVSFHDSCFVEEERSLSQSSICKMDSDKHVRPRQTIAKKILNSRHWNLSKRLWQNPSRHPLIT